MNRVLTRVLCLIGLAAAGCGGSHSPGSSAPARSGTVDVAYRNITISPAQITIKTGSNVKWSDFDSGVQHDVVVQSGPQRFSSPNLSQGSVYSFTFTRPGVYHYLCNFHPASMVGTITVVQ